MDLNQIEKIIKIIVKLEFTSLTKEEELILNGWLSNSIKNRELFDKLRNNKNNIDYLSKDQSIDIIKVKKEMENRIKRSLLRKKYIRIVQWSVGVASFVIISFLMLHNFSTTNERNFDGITLITPSSPMLYIGTSKAITLNNASIRLDNGKLTVIKKGVDAVPSSEETISLEQTAEVVYSKLVVPKGSMFDFVLEDGSHVWLNAESELKYPITFDKEAREVELISGEAFFDVVVDKERPFKVVSNGQIVTVYGTEFDVNLYSNNEIFTTLISGSISVSSGDKMVNLIPGMRSIVSDEEIVIEETSVDKIALWRNGYFVFEAKKLEQVMNDLSRWYDMEVEYEYEELKKIQFKGSVMIGKEISSVLKILEMTKEISFSVKGNRVLIKKGTIK